MYALQLTSDAPVSDQPLDAVVAVRVRVRAVLAYTLFVHTLGIVHTWKMSRRQIRMHYRQFNSMHSAHAAGTANQTASLHAAQFTTCRALSVEGARISQHAGGTAVVGGQVVDVELVTDAHLQRVVTLRVLDRIRTLEIHCTVLVQAV